MSSSALPPGDAKMLKRAGRLAAAAQALDDIDIQKLASNFQKETGSSGIEAAAVAAATVNATLQAALHGQRGRAAADAAEREARTVVKKQARGIRSEEWRAQQRDEQGAGGDGRREDARAFIELRSARAAESKAERIADAAATRRALREERALAASSRRTLSEARAKYGAAGRAGSPGSPTGAAPDDPALKKARALCSGASRIVAQLEEEQARLLRRSAPSWSPSRPSMSPRPRPAPRPRPESPESEQLMAKARELLADYQPGRRRPPVPIPRPPRPKDPGACSPSSASRPAGLTAEITFERARRNLCGK